MTLTLGVLIGKRKVGQMEECRIYKPKKDGELTLRKTISKEKCSKMFWRDGQGLHDPTMKQLCVSEPAMCPRCGNEFMKTMSHQKHCQEYRNGEALTCNMMAQRESANRWNEKKRLKVLKAREERGEKEKVTCKMCGVNQFVRRTFKHEFCQKPCTSLDYNRAKLREKKAREKNARAIHS